MGKCSRDLNRRLYVFSCLPIDGSHSEFTYCEIVAGCREPSFRRPKVIQLLNIHDTTLDEARYFDVIERKTGVLFEAAARMASVVAGASKEVEDKMAEYALCLGRAFQIIDDVLDYTGSKDNIGKNLGTDFAKEK